MPKIYFNYDDKDSIADWLKTKPDGAWQVLIGTDDDQADVPQRIVSLAVACGGNDLVAWLVAKLKAGEMIIKECVSTPDLPAGVALPDESEEQPDPL